MKMGAKKMICEKGREAEQIRVETGNEPLFRPLFRPLFLPSLPRALLPSVFPLAFYRPSTTVDCRGLAPVSITRTPGTPTTRAALNLCCAMCAVSRTSISPTP